MNREKSVANVAKTFGESQPAETLGEFRYPKAPCCLLLRLHQGGQLVIQLGSPDVVSDHLAFLIDQHHRR